MVFGAYFSQCLRGKELGLHFDAVASTLDQRVARNSVPKGIVETGKF